MDTKVLFLLNGIGLGDHFRVHPEVPDNLMGDPGRCARYW